MKPSVTKSAAPRKVYRFVGGVLCLDFCNSVGGKREGVPRESLHEYGDFLSWSQQAGLIERQRMRAFEQSAMKNPAEAAEVLGRAITLRESVYLIFLAIINGKRPAERDLQTVNSELEKSLGRLRVVPEKNGYSWAWELTSGVLDSPLGPIARSAGELLTAKKLLPNVQQCEGQNCGWLFLDSSKNHSRSWCDMRDCGNLAKVRRHRMRLKLKPS